MPQRAEKTPKENNIQIISLQLSFFNISIMFLVQPENIGSYGSFVWGWSHVLHQLSLLLSLLSKYQLKFCLLNFVRWLLGSCWQKLRLVGADAGAARPKCDMQSGSGLHADGACGGYLGLHDLKLEFSYTTNATNIIVDAAWRTSVRK